MYALINSKIYTGKKILHDHAVVISDNIIVDVCPTYKLNKNIKIYNLSGAILAPGFIDLQINGCGGVQFNDYEKSITVYTLKKMQDTNQRSGCTSFLPTLITSNDTLMRKAITIIRNFLSNNKYQVLGLHLEGPFLNFKKRGIHNSSLIRLPTIEIIDYLCDNKDVIKQITLAPERFNVSFLKKLVQSGIYVAVGHSDATYVQTLYGFLSGITFGTHLFNAMSSLTAREPGVVGALLDMSNIYCSIIADGIHVNWPNIKFAKKIKGDHLILVTDATSPSGADYITHFKFSGKIIYHNNGICTDNYGILGGSTLTMIQAIKNSVVYANIELDEAIRMATLYPARAIGIDHILGSIEINKVANLTAFTSKYQIQKTIVNGKIVFLK